MNNYAYLNARVTILAGRLLSETRLTELLNQPMGQQRLGNASLDDLLNDTTVDPSRIEHFWLMQLLADFQVLIRPLSGTARELLRYWIHKCEIANLKAIVRGKIKGLDANTIAAQLIQLGALSTLTTEQLLHTEDIGELLRRLENTPYNTIANAARRVFEQEHQLYSLDAAIDRHYLLGIVQRVRALDTKQRQHLLPLISIFMDRFNLLWLLRYRFAYGLSAAETYYLLVPTSYKLNRSRLQQLVELNTFSEVITQLPPPLNDMLAEADNTFDVDQLLIHEIRRVAQSILALQNFTLAKIFAYILLREMEMRRVMTIIKGKRLNFDNKVISFAAEYSTALMA
jgi:V/A-type H+-transporting ATPase subunit C